MLRKTARANAILDKLHKGVVCACVGITLYGTYLFGWRIHRYFTVIKPQKDQKQLMEKQNLLAEGSSDMLKDMAPQLKT